MLAFFYVLVATVFDYKSVVSAGEGGVGLFSLVLLGLLSLQTLLNYFY